MTAKPECEDGGHSTCACSQELPLYYVYIVRCADSTLYTGITTDVSRRMLEHNSGTGAKYTRSRCPVECVYVEECQGRSEASIREAAIKKLSRKAKLELITQKGE